MTADIPSLAQNPFAVITIIAAPAILTNASSILTLSTTTRLMRCLDRISALNRALDETTLTGEQREAYKLQAELSHKQSRQFLGALRWIYVALAAFAIASFLALIGASTLTVLPRAVIDFFGTASLVAGGVGALGFVWSSINLIIASRITLVIMESEHEILIRKR
ncbi:MAG: DUF2721 domain-containing protein [Bdellovibrionaceae bacterium]|nr:DUF2721 domain-containing protein [Pseudobdellovibrionaceae bacterium]